jgi:superfamily II DNA or RNA helicase
MNGNKKDGNPFTKFLHTWNLYGNKHIPHIYKCNSREVRLQLLAGLIDSDGYYSNKCFDIVLKSEKLLDDVIYLARSLGFAAYKKECQKTCTNAKNGPKTGTYYRTTISGIGVEKIPTKVLRKKAEPRLQIKDVLMTRIIPTSIGMGTYYGFEIDGNRRFLLGDFTVTHNTVIALNLSSHFKKKTLVVCHTEFLMDQWIERIEQYLPTATTGKIKQKICQVEGKDIVIASLQSLAMRDYDSAIFKGFGFVVLDECHHLGAEVFSRCLPKITCKRMLGLSATLKRKDGLSKVFEWYLGKPVFTIKRKDSEVKVLIERFYDPHPEYGRELKLWNTGKLNVARMINKICEFPPRNHRIVQVLNKVLEEEPNRKVLVLSERRTHLQDLESLLRLEQFTSIGYYVGGMSKQQLDEGSSHDIILATFQLASEAMDIPKLNTLILGSPVSSIEQPIGRIQRKKKEEREYIPLVIDLLDEFSIFERQGAKRIAFYKKNEYEIIDTVKEQKSQQEKRRYTLIKDEDED